jgi:hypothetical protein
MRNLGFPDCDNNMRAPSRKSASSRRAMSLVEMTAALVVMGAAMVALVEFVGLAKNQRRMSHQRLAALMEVGNQAERLALLDWNATAPDKLMTWQPSPLMAAEIPTADCRIHVVEEEQSPAARRIELSIGWMNAAGQPVEPVSLTVWKYRGEGK